MSIKIELQTNKMEFNEFQVIREKGQRAVDLGRIRIAVGPVLLWFSEDVAGKLAHDIIANGGKAPIEEFE